MTDTVRFNPFSNRFPEMTPLHTERSVQPGLVTRFYG